ncbi:MAG: hypothetical protein HOP19_08405, partial [Acidobacteria bacterium]|nr:hypothetical protein [Acidobacteriota bacterium]
GQIVQKFDHDLPFESPLATMEGRKKGVASFTDNFLLQPGRYTVETVVQDRITNKTSARRSALVVAPIKEGGLRMSNLTLIKRIDPVIAETRDVINPLNFTGGKVIPNLGDNLKAQAGAQVAFYTVIYPASGNAEKPQLAVELSLDGKALTGSALPLPEPDAQGRIHYIARMPLEALQPGTYQIRAVLRQGQNAVQESAVFTVE